jgi:hypothetical protein
MATNNYEVTIRAHIIGPKGTRSTTYKIYNGGSFVNAEVTYDKLLSNIAIDWPFGLRDAITFTLTENEKIVRQYSMTNN